MEEGEIPLINCNRHNFKEKLRELLEDRERMAQIGRRSRSFVLRHHSVDAMAKRFARANTRMGIQPSLRDCGSSKRA